MYTLSRGRDADDEQYALHPIGSDMRIRTQNWAIVLAAFELPFQVKSDDQPDPHVQGDVTGDGTVDVSDVNIIINVMLGKEINERADVTGEGSVDVADVNQVINIMLGKN